MYFVFSKILLFLIIPLNWILALFFAGLLVKKVRLKRRLLGLSFCLLVIFTNPLLVNIFARAWNVKSNELPGSGYSCGIVLGGFSGNIYNGSFNWAADRFIQAEILQTTGKTTHLLITGGSGSLINRDGYEEGKWAKSQLMKLKYPDSCVLEENNSRNTFENAEFSKEVLQAHHLKPPYVLITSEFHMRRSLLIFKKAGIDVLPYSCNTIAGGEKFTVSLLFPQASTLSNWEVYLKEVIGWLVTWIAK